MPSEVTLKVTLLRGNTRHRQRTSYHLSTPIGQFFYPICTTDSRRMRLAS